MSAAEMEALLARVPEDPEGCPFCGKDPYEYVDIGVGFERVAVSCCGLGIGLLQYGDEQIAAEAALRRDLAAALRASLARIAELEALLKRTPGAFNNAFMAGTEECENGSANRQGRLMEKVEALQSDIRAALARPGVAS